MICALPDFFFKKHKQMSFGNAVHIFKYQSSKPYNSIGRQTNKQTIFKIVVQVKIQHQGHK